MACLTIQELQKTSDDISLPELLGRTKLKLFVCQKGYKVQELRKHVTSHWSEAPPPELAALPRS